MGQRRGHFRRSSNGHDPENKEGYAKIEGFCRQALDDGFEYLWMDTCCIDKSSSAELSEAINSMFKWYRQAIVCYVYLRDVPSDQDPAAAQSLFRGSEWFKRGWTLQELIGPSSVLFLAKNWSELGSKSSLATVIEEITGIDIRTLKNGLSKFTCIQQKMAWAAGRQTTRVEDRAYSLMGIFDVNMPIIYGEGLHAFIRLQQELMHCSFDHTLFVFERQSAPVERVTDVLASSPDDFANAINVIPIDYDQLTTYLRVPDGLNGYGLTSLGLQIQLPLQREADSGGESYFRAYLACSFGEERESVWIYLLLRHDMPPGHYFRIKYGRKSLHHGHNIDLSSIMVQRIHIARAQEYIRHSRLEQRFMISRTAILRLGAGCHGFRMIDSYLSPSPQLSVENQTIILNPWRFGSDHAAFIFHNENTMELFAVVLGFENYHDCGVIIIDERTTAEELSKSKAIIDRPHALLRGCDWVRIPLVSTRSGLSKEMILKRMRVVGIVHAEKRPDVSINVVISIKET